MKPGVVGDRASRSVKIDCPEYIGLVGVQTQIQVVVDAQLPTLVPARLLGVLVAQMQSRLEALGLGLFEQGRLRELQRTGRLNQHIVQIPGFHVLVILRVG